jgi:hypothetical protein
VLGYDQGGARRVDRAGTGEAGRAGNGREAVSAIDRGGESPAAAPRASLVGQLRDLLLGRSASSDPVHDRDADLASDEARVSATSRDSQGRQTVDPGATRAPTLDQTRRARSFWDEKHAHDVANQARAKPALDPIDYTRHWFLYNHAVSRPLTGDCARYWLDEIGARHLRPRPERMLEEPALAGAPATISGDADPLDAIDALLDELERALLDQRDAGELDALAAQLESVAARLERVG